MPKFAKTFAGPARQAIHAPIRPVILSAMRPATRLAILPLFAAALLCAPASLQAQAPATSVAVPAPPMGWSSWNSFSNTIDSQITQAQARAMISSGMHKAGYQYINIDEGWWLGQRDSDGNIVVSPQAWPALAPGERDGDMANIVRFLHGLGLKAGIYTDAGTDGCSTTGPDLGPSYPLTGSENHYEQDFLQFARWGFDYVKVDWCGGYKENLDPAVQYAEVARAIAHAEAVTGHRLYFSICNWGKDSPFTWGPNVGGVAADIWRTGGDIVAPIVAGTKNAGRRAEFKEVLREFDQAQHPDAQHTGFYNDPDMMVVGMPGLTAAQNRAHISLWAVSGGPLIAGADLTQLTPEDIATLTNPDLLRIDQDPLGLQAVRIGSTANTAAASSPPAPGLEVWSKPMAANGQRAVLFLNRTSFPAPVSVRWSDLGLLDSPATVRDVWAARDLGSLASGYSATVPAGDLVLLLVHGAEAPEKTYTPTDAGPGTDQDSERLVAFPHVASRFPIARVRIVYANPGQTTRFAELRVNGRIATRVAFPPSPGGAAEISIESTLNTGQANNSLIFSLPSEAGLTLRSIALQ
jgi:hypothetical protein